MPWYILVIPLLFVGAFAAVLRVTIELFDGIIAAKIGHAKVAQVEFYVYISLTYVSFVLLVLFGMWVQRGFV